MEAIESTYPNTNCLHCVGGRTKFLSGNGNSVKRDLLGKNKNINNKMLICRHRLERESSRMLEEKLKYWLFFGETFSKLCKIWSFFYR